MPRSRNAVPSDRFNVTLPGPVAERVRALADDQQRSAAATIAALVTGAVMQPAASASAEIPSVEDSPLFHQVVQEKEELSAALGDLRRQVAAGRPGSARGDDQEQPPRWAWPLDSLLADDRWWRRWLPRLYELLGSEIGGLYAAPDGGPKDDRGYLDLMAYLFPPAGGLAWNSPAYGATMLADRADLAPLGSSAGPPRGHVWEPVIRHVACALAALEATQQPGADPYRVIGVQAEISGPWLATLTQLLGRSPAAVRNLPGPR